MDLATGHVAALNKLEKQHLKIKVHACHSISLIINFTTVIQQKTPLQILTPY